MLQPIARVYLDFFVSVPHSLVQPLCQHFTPNPILLSKSPNTTQCVIYGFPEHFSVLGESCRETQISFFATRLYCKKLRGLCPVGMDLSLSRETTAKDEPCEGPALSLFQRKHLCIQPPQLPGESATVQVIHLAAAFSEGPSFHVRYGCMSLEPFCEKELKFLSTQDLNQIREEIHPPSQRSQQQLQHWSSSAV